MIKPKDIHEALVKQWKGLNVKAILTLHGQTLDESLKARNSDRDYWSLQLSKEINGHSDLTFETFIKDYCGKFNVVDMGLLKKDHPGVKKLVIDYYEKHADLALENRSDANTQLMDQLGLKFSILKDAIEGAQRSAAQNKLVFTRLEKQIESSYKTELNQIEALKKKPMSVELRNELLRGEKAYENADKTYKEMAAEIEKSTNQLKSLQKPALILQNEIRTNEDQNKKLQDQVNKLESKQSTAVKELEDLNLKSKTLTAKLTELKQKTAELQKKKTEADQKITEIENTPVQGLYNVMMLNKDPVYKESKDLGKLLENNQAETKKIEEELAQTQAQIVKSTEIVVLLKSSAVAISDFKDVQEMTAKNLSIDRRALQEEQLKNQTKESDLKTKINAYEKKKEEASQEMKAAKEKQEKIKQQFASEIQANYIKQFQLAKDNYEAALHRANISFISDQATTKGNFLRTLKNLKVALR